MKEIGAVVVMTTPKRHYEAKVVVKLLRTQCDPLGIDVLVAEDEGWKCARKTSLKALSMPVQSCKRRLVLHDDLIMPRGALQMLVDILPAFPDSLVSCYCPANRGYDAAYESHKHVLKTSSNIWNQAMVYPESFIGPYLEYDAARIVDDYIHDDRAVAAFLRDTGRFCYCIVPSVFQHMGAYRSAMGWPGKVFKQYRYSEHFIPGFDFRSVDWERELLDPHISESPFPTKEMFK